ncbi:Kelch repeat:Kelch precursor [Labilithrix luteola]|uniref:Kelch repeat:Kelch n=1 Tax=Labilithrix luteola TaxID=1391654 RepID=A0A0K1PQ57_9BACT|nr:Kelch repeat:Kelch precursor [Labilithrix luteola]
MYDVVNDTWSRRTSSNPPTGRMRHTTVWTGTKMVVWGGTTRWMEGNMSRDAVLDDGAVYDPQADAWRAMSTVDMPSARMDQPAVWTGEKMLVWGGRVPLELTSRTDGAAYDLERDAWSAMSAVNAPFARSSHSAVWTGKEMLVWGGQTKLAGAETVSALGDGAAYDPVLDRWRPISSVGAPSPRVGHCAVWTGDKMIVWGGYGDGNNLADGGIYDVATDTWLSTRLEGAPVGRGLHFGVWTGSSLMVWGGDALHMIGAGYGDGGLFTP